MKNVGAIILRKVGSNFVSKEMFAQLFMKNIDPNFMKNVVTIFNSRA
jgi:hypothetical protein